MGHEVTRVLLAALLALLACAAAAQDNDPLDLLPGVGIGLDFIGTRDSERFVRRRTRLVSAVRYDSPYDFWGVAAGTEYFKQDDWSLRGYSLSGLFEKRDKATGAGISASIGLVNVDRHDRAVADAVWNHRFSPQTGGELILQHDLVATRVALDAGVTHSFVAASVDHAFSDRWTGIALAGGQRFSDGNDRAHLRGWLIYALAPEYGLSLQARARGYENSRTGSPFYFNPDRYETADIGFRWRKGLAGWRFFAVLAAGEERIDGGLTNTTRFAQLNADRVIAGDIRLGMRYAYVRAAGENAPGASSGYDWQYLRFFIVAPL